MFQELLDGVRKQIMASDDEVILRFIENQLINDQDFLSLYRNIVGEQKAGDTTPANVYKELG